jgi:DNA-binding GntR family transcriptional regulator
MDSGEWPPGYRLPPDRELREQLEVSQIVIRFAMERLKDRIESQQGVGRFVKK